jgi:WD40 repeat protein
MTFQSSTFRLLASLVIVLLFVATASAQDGPKTEIVPNIPHITEVSAVAFSANGSRVLSGSRDKTLRLWDASTGQLLRIFRGDSDTVRAVAVSPDGTHLLSAGGDAAIKLWDAATGQVVRDFKGHTAEVVSVTFSPNGTRVLSGAWDGTIKLWDPATGQLLHTFAGHSDKVYSVAFSPDGSRVLSGSGDRTLKLWDAATGQLLRTFVGHEASVITVAFSRDGMRVLSGAEDHNLRVWDATTGQLLRTFSEPPPRTRTLSIAFSPDGTRAISSSGDTAKLWDVATGQLMRTFEGHALTVFAVAFSPNGANALLASYVETQLWDVDSGLLLRKLGANAGNIFSVAFSPDGSRVVSGSFDRTVKLWDVRTGQLLRAFHGHEGAVYCAAFSRDGTRVVSGGWDKTVRLWDAETGRLLRTFAGHTGWVNSVAFSPDGTRLLSGSSDDSVKLWDAETGTVLRTFATSGAVNSVAFSPDGRRVLVGSDRPQLWDTASLWDKATGLPSRTFADSRGTVWSVAFTPDGTRVLSGGEGDKVKLWDAATGQLLRTFDGHTGTVWSVSASPDGTRVLSGSLDHTIRLWELETGRLLRTFKGESGSTVVFSPNAALAASNGGDATIRLWNVSSGETVAMLLGSVDGEWLAQTPDGFFSASSKGEQMVTVMRGLEATTIEQVHQSLYSPDLLREALAGDPDGEVKRAAEVINLDKVLDSGPAPFVEINSGAVGRHSASDVVTVSARITDPGKGIGRIEWRVNGVTAAVISAASRAGREHEAQQTLALDPGENVIEVLAYNARNILASRPAQTTITYDGPADTEKRRLYVLAIGVNAYHDDGWTPPGATRPEYFPPLKLAVDDAKNIAEAFKEAGAGFYGQVIVRTALDEQATPAGLERIVQDISAEINPRDTFVLFAAAHGYSSNGRFYLLPQDYQGGTNPAALMNRAIGQDRLQDWIARIKARRGVILLDTCESGALTNGYAHSRTDAPASEAAVGRLHEATGRPVLTAAAAGKPAFEGYRSHGVFTWALLDALFHGDSNGDGLIELSELAAHVQNTVPKISAEMNGRGIAEVLTELFRKDRQTAHFGSTGGDFPVVRRLQ